MNRELIHQRLEVKEWPLKKIGAEAFFGYVVAIGVFPKEWGDTDGMTQFVDFAYNDSYERFRLPQDVGLKRQLIDTPWDNLNGVEHTGDIYGKVWIKLTKDGYEVALP